tara:strand:- start:1168 stop:1566 length:399 start_codon:yes stop_codon:yes gene_type:complete
MNIQTINLPTFSDDRGNLTVLENLKDVPFDFQRVFYVYGVKARERRGEHAHTITSQLLVCLKGSVTVECKDGKNEEFVILDSPTKGVIIPAGIWAEQIYVEEDTILLVLCDHLYFEEDYIRDYKEFLKWKES